MALFLFVDIIAFLPVIVAGQKFPYFFGGSIDVGHGRIMVHKIDDGGQKFAHVGFYVVGAVVKLRNPVGKIGGHYLVEIAFFVGFIKESRPV